MFNGNKPQRQFQPQAKLTWIRCPKFISDHRDSRNFWQKSVYRTGHWFLYILHCHNLNRLITTTFNLTSPQVEHIHNSSATILATDIQLRRTNSKTYNSPKVSPYSMLKATNVKPKNQNCSCIKNMKQPFRTGKPHASGSAFKFLVCTTFSSLAVHTIYRFLYSFSQVVFSLSRVVYSLSRVA